jgi:hypothetical protein
MEPSLEWPLEESLAGTGLHQFVRQWRERSTPDEPAEAYESFEPALYAPGRWGLAFCVKLTRVGYGSGSFMYHRDIPSM